VIFGPLLWVGLNVPLVALFTFTDWDSAALMLFGGIFGGAYGLGYLVGDWWALALPLPLSLGVSVYVVVGAPDCPECWSATWAIFAAMLFAVGAGIRRRQRSAPPVAKPVDSRHSDV
jgi:hypothetical protein